VTDRVNRPHFKPGRKRLYVRDSLSKTKRGKNAIKKVEKIRIKALRVKTVNAQTLNEIEKKNADRVLTEKQRMFVRYWAQGETPRTACLMAGFSESSVGLGWKLAHDPAILKIYREEKKLYEAAQGHTKARVMSMLQEAYDCAKLISEPATMVAAARELGRWPGTTSLRSTCTSTRAASSWIDEFPERRGVAEDHGPGRRAARRVRADRGDSPRGRQEWTDRTSADQAAIHRELASRVLARRRLLAFIQRLDPTYLAGWVHRDICMRLEKFSDDVAKGLSPRLMLLMPPRHGKSRIASMAFPAWHLGRYPIMSSSRRRTTWRCRWASRASARRVMNDPRYPFEDVRLDPNNQSAETWGLVHKGSWRRAASSRRASAAASRARARTCCPSTTRSRTTRKPTRCWCVKACGIGMDRRRTRAWRPAAACW
jgi:hypothetical protein